MSLCLIMKRSVHFKFWVRSTLFYLVSLCFILHYSYSKYKFDYLGVMNDGEWKYLIQFKDHPRLKFERSSPFYAHLIFDFLVK